LIKDFIVLPSGAALQVAKVLETAWNRFASASKHAGREVVPLMLFSSLSRGFRHLHRYDSGPMNAAPHEEGVEHMLDGLLQEVRAIADRLEGKPGSSA
jgi:hypothetical protein